MVGRLVFSTIYYTISEIVMTLAANKGTSRVTTLCGVIPNSIKFFGLKIFPLQIHFKV